MIEIIYIIAAIIILIIVAYIVYRSIMTNYAPVILEDYGRTGRWAAQYYNLPDPNPDENPIVAVISVGGNYSYKDLEYYWRNICKLERYPSVINVPINQEELPLYTGEVNALNLENILDLELLGSIAWNSTVLFISVPDALPDIYSGFEAAIKGVTVNNVLYQPTIISSSITSTEFFVPHYEMFRLNNLFKEASEKGIVICCASGDFGASELFPDNNMPNVTFPASSPYVVACGGTSVKLDLTEVAWSWDEEYQIGAGSGASSYFDQPGYQKGIVKFPLTKPDFPDLKNKRVIPDISMNADSKRELGYTLYYNGKLYFNRIAGTSAVAPIMAGFLASINLKYPRPFNEILYEIYRDPIERSKCFKDITSGSNDNLPNVEGTWNAQQEFDYLTGMGSIHGKNLYAALKRRSI